MEKENAFRPSRVNHSHLIDGGEEKKTVLSACRGVEIKWSLSPSWERKKEEGRPGVAGERRTAAPLSEREGCSLHRPPRIFLIQSLEGRVAVGRGELCADLGQSKTPRKKVGRGSMNRTLNIESAPGVVYSNRALPLERPSSCLSP